MASAGTSFRVRPVVPTALGVCERVCTDLLQRRDGHVEGEFVVRDERCEL